MKNILLIAVFMCGVFTNTANAQKAELTEGNVDMLKGVKKMNVRYDYSNMLVGHKSEKEFIAEKKEKLDSKEPGRGDKWEANWKGDRGNRFEPRFEEEFNKVCDIQLRSGNTEKYTLIFNTTYTEPGFNIGITKRNAYIDGEAWIVETANPGKILAKIEIDNCPGRTFMGTDYDTGERIQEAYAMAAKGLAKFFNKEL